jgi:hypothetical protein
MILALTIIEIIGYAVGAGLIINGVRGIF